MKSATSLFNKAVIRRNLTRFSTIWVLYLVALLVMLPVTILFHEPGYVGAEAAVQIYSMLRTVSVLLAFGYGCILAMALWSYLYSSASVHFMHSLPVSRDGLYVSNFVSGALMCLVPNLAAALCTLLVCSVRGSMNAAPAVLAWFGGMCAMELFFFGFATFTAMFTGSILALPVFYGILNFLLMGISLMVTTYITSFLFGVEGIGGFGEALSSSWSSVVEWCSPMVQLLDRPVMSVTYDDVPVAAAVAGQVFHRCAVSVEYSGAGVYTAYAAAGLVFAVLGWLAGRVRRSESAGEIVVFGWAGSLFRVGVGFCFAFTLGLGVASLIFHDNTTGVGALVAMILAGILGYVLARMLTERSTGVLRKSVRGSALCAALVLAVFLAAKLDIAGLETRVPASGEISSVSVSVSTSEGWSSGTVREEEALAALQAVHSYLVENRDQLQDETEQYLAAAQDVTGDPVGNRSVFLTLDYTLRSGNTIRRIYSVIPETDELETLLRRLVLTEEYRLSNALHGIDPDTDRVISASFNDYRRVDTISGEEQSEYVELEITPEQAQRVIEAVRRDVRENGFGSMYDIYDGGAKSHMRVELDSRDSYPRYSYIEFFPGMDYTQAVLQELGLLGPEEKIMSWGEFESSFGGSEIAVG